MSHLKLVATDIPRKRRLSSPMDAQRPVPTPEFLARRILSLPFGEQTIGAMLAEMANPFRHEIPNFLRRSSELTDALMLAGIWPMHPDIDDPMPIHGMVVNPAKLVKRYPELKRVVEQLDGLQLVPVAA
jgi:hypothetical protein